MGLFLESKSTSMPFEKIPVRTDCVMVCLFVTSTRRIINLSLLLSITQVKAKRARSAQSASANKIKNSYSKLTPGN